MPPSDSLPSPERLVDNQPDGSPAVGPRALAALHELAVAASGVLEPMALAKMAVDLACDLLGVDGAALYWWVSSTGLLHSLADNREYQAGGSRPRSHRRSRPVVWTSTSPPPSSAFADCMAASPAASWCSAPPASSSRSTRRASRSSGSPPRRCEARHRTSSGAPMVTTAPS